MPTVFRLPDIGEGLTEAEIVEWHHAVGEEVRADQPLVTVETDKAQADLPAPVSGVLLHRGAEAGTVLAVGDVLAVIGIRGERWSGGDALGGAQAELPLADVPEERPPLVGTLAEEAEDLGVEPVGGSRDSGRGTEEQSRGSRDAGRGTDAESSAGPVPPAPDVLDGGTRPKALPLVRREATRRGIDLSSIEGSGPGGRILRSDLDEAVAPSGEGRLPTAEPPATDQSPAPALASSFRDPSPATRDPKSRVPLSATRKAIARNLSESWRTIPHVTTFDRFDATRLLEVRRSLERRHRRSVPLDALLVAATLPVLDTHPTLVSHLDGDELVVAASTDVGVAVDTPGGLLVAVVADAPSLGVLGIAERIVDLAERARARSLAAGEMRGQAFTVSNIGAVGGGHGTPIIPLGTSAILSVGRAEDTPVARDGQVVVAPMAPLSLSYDHRIIDGAEGRAIMAMLVENLTEPALFLI